MLIVLYIESIYRSIYLAIYIKREIIIDLLFRVLAMRFCSAISVEATIVWPGKVFYILYIIMAYFEF